MRGRIVFAVAALGVLGALAAGTALATQPCDGCFMPTLLARGAAGEFKIDDKSAKLKFVAKRSTDVPLVRATLTANGFTGWHGHAGPSLVVVSRGELTMSQPVRRGGDDDEDGGDEEGGGEACEVQLFRAGTAFVHPEGPHNFVAGGAGAEFYIVYFLPAGASPAPIDVTPAPSACS